MKQVKLREQTLQQEHEFHVQKLQTRLESLQASTQQKNAQIGELSDQVHSLEESERKQEKQVS